jgi:hypothetical protein
METVNDNYDGTRLIWHSQFLSTIMASSPSTSAEWAARFFGAFGNTMYIQPRVNNAALSGGFAVYIGW